MRLMPSASSLNDGRSQRQRQVDRMYLLLRNLVRADDGVLSDVAFVQELAERFQQKRGSDADTEECGRVGCGGRGRPATSGCGKERRTDLQFPDRGPAR